MTAEEYLRSEEAVRDVAAALDRHHGGTDEGDERWTIARGVIWDESCPWLMAFCVGAHEEGRDGNDDPIYRALPGEPEIAYPTRQTAHVYFRAEGDRYLVTDIGEAVRALWLKTGNLEADGAVWRAWESGLEVGGVFLGKNTLRAYCPAADLPRAIARVMLAALRVASLETP